MTFVRERNGVIYLTTRILKGLKFLGNIIARSDENTISPTHINKSSFSKPFK